jgi:Xaa-Pro aminopeptidase
MSQPHAARRRRLLTQIGDGVVLLPTAPEAVRNADCHYPYRADSHFLYLTGFAEPEAVLLLDGRSGKSILFCRERNPEMEIWEGFRHGPDGAREVFGFDEAYALSEMAERIPELLIDRSQLWWPLGHDEAFDRRVNTWLEAVRAQARSGARPPSQYGDLRVLLDEMRMVKDEDEIALLRRAGEISAAGHIQAMRAARPGMNEYQLEAELLHAFVGRGARYQAYESIVAAGANACTLHYVANDARIRDGDLVLIDAGCELQGYAGDITRTFPANGRFSGPQRDVYEVVLAAEAGRGLACARRRRAARAGARHAGPGLVERHAGWRDRVRRVPPFLHAWRRPHDRPGRARCRPAQAAWPVAQLPAGHVHHHRAGPVYPVGRRCAGGFPQYRRAHRGRCAGHRGRQ